MIAHFKKHRQFLSFSLVGGLCFLFSLALMLLFVEALNIPYLPATVLTWICANLLSFVANKQLTFRTHRKFWKNEIIRYYLIMSANLGISVLLMFVMVDLLHLHYLLSSIFMAGLMLCINYLAHKNWSFRTGGSNRE